MLWILYICIILIMALVVIIVVKTRNFKPVELVCDSSYVESNDLAGPSKLADAVRIPTISYIEAGKMDDEAFREFHKLLEKQFPLVHKCCEKTIINKYSLVYCLKTKNPRPSEKPILITAHMDVVPVEEGTEGDWIKQPYSGEIADGIVWGRGTLDTKVHLIGALEAMEHLLEKDFSPARDIYLAFGHDEEINGEEGALKIAEYFENEGLEFDFVLDEGGCAVTNVLEGIEKPIAMVGVGEKGFANIRLSVTMDGGHASMPAPHTSLGTLAKALCLLEEHPFKPRLISCTKDFLLRIGPYMKGVNRVVLANLWIFKPLFLSMFSKTNTGGALLRTTMAVTMAQGSPAPNVVPQKSSAFVNCRILPGENGEMLLDHMKKTLKGLPVKLDPIALDDPSALSPCDCNAYRLIESLIGEFCGDVIVVPYLVMASTDARKYEAVCKNIYRFTPYIIDNEDIRKIHGTNENISVANVNRCIDFFTALMERL
ncbi:MAG: peptidase M20 [Firmicutes bacterium HGW-Firmicutes-16]|nr:MAG: peptidase M20 [Firmicutes bacterium HGW-Firmicutes-16]